MQHYRLPSTQVEAKGYKKHRNIKNKQKIAKTNLAIFIIVMIMITTITTTTTQSSSQGLKVEIKAGVASEVICSQKSVKYLLQLSLSLGLE